MTRGFFISFDGPDGGGKTTQIERLRVRLEAMGHQVVKTREIGGTPEAEKIRDLVVRKSGGNWSPLAQLLLAFTARLVHTEDLIKPALAQNKIVLTDRYADSTYVYQVVAGGLPPERFDEIYKFTLGSFKPDLTLILDVDAALATVRTGRSVQANVSREEKADDRFESQGETLQAVVRRSYLDIAARNPGRCVVIDASRPVDDVADIVWKTVEQRLIAHG